MILLYLALALILLILALDNLIGFMYRYKIKPHTLTPKKYSIDFDEIHIPGVDGAQLYGWWIPTSAESPTLILIHGWGRNLSRTMPHIRKLHQMGYNLLAFDARNHGSSSPIKHPSVGSFTEDALAAVDFIANSDMVTSNKIGILGLSIGGGAAINAAGQDERIKCAITVGAISHPKEVMKIEFEKRNIPNFIPRLLFGYMSLRFGLDFEKIAPINNISNAKAKILLIHGDEDETIPLGQGKALVETGNPDKVSLWIVPGKGHSNCYTHPEFWERVGVFLEESF